tara:strand:- start:7031 stop:9721 length:2691 start_codon:yes stop_codon:yes gene_type:complete
MAVAAADFYTYARATGTPLPKSKQEEAKLAPAVDKWKKSRLSNTRQEEKGIDAGQVAGLTAIGAAALAAFNPGARQRIAQAVRPAPKGGTATSTNVGGIKQDLNVELDAEIPTPIAKSWADQKSKQTFVVEKVPETTVVEKIDSNLATTPVRKEAEAKQALDAYRDKYIREHSVSRENIAAIQQGIKESGGLRKEVRPDLSNLTEDQQKYLDFKIEEQASYDPKLEAQLQSQTIEQKQQVSTPRDYIESTGAIEAKSNQVTAVDASKLDDVAVSQQAIENTNLNLQDELHQAPQVGIDPEVSEVASSAISAQSGAVPVEKVVGNQQIVYTTPTRIQGRKTGIWSPGVLSAEEIEGAKSQVSAAGPFLREYTTLGSKIAGDTNIQKGVIRDPQLELPIIYNARGRLNPTLKTESITNVDDYLERYKPTKEDVIMSPLERKIAKQDLIDNAYLKEREEQLIKAGLKPGTTRFENALVAGWSAKPNIKQTITGENFRENVVLPKEVEDYISTKIPETDASNVARDYYNPDTGDIQYPTVKGDAPLIRDVYKERVIDNEELKNAASGTSIRGKSRSLDIQEPKVRTRTDEFTGEVRPDRIGGTLPIGGIPADLQPSQLSKQEVVQSIINPSSVSREDLTGGGAGMGVYGRQLGYVPGPTSKTAGTRPTQLPEGKYGEFNPTTQRDEFRGYSNEALRKRISDGTYRSGKVSPAAVEAQQELTLRQNLNYPENYTPTKQTTLDAMKVSDDIRKIYSSGRPDAQQQVDLYLKAQGAPQRTSTSFVVNEDVDLRGTPVKLGEQPIETSVTQTKFAQPLNYPAAQNQVTYVPPTESTIKSLSVTPSELEKAERMHLLNYISAAHGQIKGGARAGGTKMRNNLTPYQTPSDAMLNQLVMKRRMERI